MTDGYALPHIAVVLSATEAPVRLLADLRRLTDSSFADLKASVAQGRPILLTPMFDNAFYHDGADRLRAVVDCLEQAGAAFSLYELAEGERFETRDESLNRITSETLKNILQSAEHD